MMFTFDWGDELPKLTGHRVELRWLTRHDAPAILAIFGDAEVVRYWSTPPLRSLGEATDLIEEIHQLFRSRRLFQWGVFRPETNEVIGTCTLFNIDPRHQRAEVGFALGRSEWGHGLATEALEVLIRFAYQTLNIHRLEADVDPENERSLRLLGRQGFQREGFLRQRWYHLGEFRDTILLGLLRNEWSGFSAAAGGAWGRTK
jgi:RimJ/RimL family protein N-acetyltransferase